MYGSVSQPLGRGPVTGPRLIEKRIYRPAVWRRLRTPGIQRSRQYTWHWYTYRRKLCGLLCHKINLSCHENKIKLLIVGFQKMKHPYNFMLPFVLYLHNLIFEPFSKINMMTFNKLISFSITTQIYVNRKQGLMRINEGFITILIVKVKKIVK
jgi:hypothetical protein